ncbi:MAG TPA: hypothetical protein VGA20_04375 [Gemmatimonadales bacterium]|jgi:hypothetical protein
MYAINQIGAENLAVSTSEVALTGVSGKTSNRVLIHVGDAPIRWRADGTAPTSTTGMYVAAGDYIDWTDSVTNYRGLIGNVQFIRDTSAGGDATLAVAYFD